MTRLFLIIIIATQLSGCAALLETTAGTFIGTLGAEVVKSKLKEMKDGDEKERVHKSQD
tara:strand:+ start:380 stop:556 length:177 start_codon:yes stop_codon:yes gene_type:complete